MNSTLERLKAKLNNGDLTRAEVNAAEPEDNASAEWKEWNKLRVKMNDMMWELVGELNARLTLIETNHMTDLDDAIKTIDKLTEDVREIQNHLRWDRVKTQKN